MAADQHREPGKIGGWRHEFHSAYSRIMQPILRQPLPMKGYKPQALLWILLLLTTHPCYGAGEFKGTRGIPKPPTVVHNPLMAGLYGGSGIGKAPLDSHEICLIL